MANNGIEIVKQGYKDRVFSFNLSTTVEGSAMVLKELKKFMDEFPYPWAYSKLNSQVVD